MIVINGIRYAPVNSNGECLRLGDMLLAKRLEANLTLKDAAKLIECSKSYLWSLEKNKKEPGFGVASRISKAYGIPLEVLSSGIMPETTMHGGLNGRTDTQS